jgi:hypothetical protein
MGVKSSRVKRNRHNAYRSATGFDFAINGTVAEEIGLAIPADLEQYVKKAE